MSTNRRVATKSDSTTSASSASSLSASSPAASPPSPRTPTDDDLKQLAADIHHNSKVTKKPKRFKLLRSLALADFITLSNAACGILSMFCCLNFLVNKEHRPYLIGAFILLPAALLFDIADGSVARWRQSNSPYGKDLDSLADVVSFSVAPSVLAFTLGCRGMFDMIILSYFVCCGIGRLARFNVSAMALSGGTGKVKYYQGFPVPTSVLLVLLLSFLYSRGLVLDSLWLGRYELSVGPLSLGTFHPFSLFFAFVGSMMISEIKVPKP